MNADAPTTERELAREAERLLLRYVQEVVLPLNLCPWARPVLGSEKLKIEPICADFSGPDRVERAARSAHGVLERAHAEPDVEIVMIPFPRLEMGRTEFDAVLRALRATDREATFALAAFHPEQAPNLTSADQAVAFLRRSPDPMIQAVRSSVLSSIDPGRGEGTSFISVLALANAISERPRASLRSKILKANWETLGRTGPEQVESTLQEIFRDRDRSYAPFLGHLSKTPAPTTPPAGGG